MLFDYTILYLHSFFWNFSDVRDVIFISFLKFNDVNTLLRGYFSSVAKNEKHSEFNYKNISENQLCLNHLRPFKIISSHFNV